MFNNTNQIEQARCVVALTATSNKDDNSLVGPKKKSHVISDRKVLLILLHY
jgi:hypothetical protein